MSKIDKVEAKRLYDIEYRLKNKDKLKKTKREYAKSTNGRNGQKRQREIRKASGYANEYNKKPEQREKERFRRYVRLYGEDWRENIKKCIVCENEKHFLEFEHAPNFPDERIHLCKECEKWQQENWGCNTRNVITAMVMRDYSNLTREDVSQHPYLIEANKLLILLKKEV